MKVALLGSGGRECALAWKISQSSLLEKLYILPGNPGTVKYGENINIKVTDFKSIENFVKKEKIDVLVVGPELPLVEGIVDFLYKKIQKKDLLIIGPNKEAASLEGSKDFAKAFMKKNNIPTANYKSFNKDNIKEGYSFLDSLKPPYVLKADGLAAGKGVLIIDDLEQAKKELSLMIKNKKFGNASNKVVVEEFLEGTEISVFVLTDGESYEILPHAKDYKRVFEKDKGPNTGGMGAVSPVPFCDRFFLDKVENVIIKPTIKGLKDTGIKYQGFIFFGLIVVGKDPYVIEYNVRLGDPETEVILPRIKSDILDLFLGIKNNTFSEKDIFINNESAATIMLVSDGYPDKYEKNKVIKNLDLIKNSLVFHAATKVKNQDILSNGGRVMAVTSKGKDLETALRKVYFDAEQIDFENKFFRKDIGKDVIKNKSIDS
tara:strand:+ start:317 stop:1612 length:1296 start_codon:yes stop_codon:yes gene_type:complete